MVIISWRQQSREKRKRAAEDTCTAEMDLAWQYHGTANHHSICCTRSLRPTVLQGALYPSFGLIKASTSEFARCI